MGTVTIGGETYDIYGEQADAIVYFGASLHAAEFNDATADDQARALVTASRKFDRQSWKGIVTDLVTPQPLAWPRKNIVDKNGEAVADSVIPDDIIAGCWEYALQNLKDSDVQDQVDTSENLKRVKAGSVEIERFRPVSGPKFGSIVTELIGFYLAGADTSGAGLATGTDGTSIYDDELYPLSDGFA